MNYSKKFAWSWTIKEEYLEQYIKLHLEPWDSIMKAHSEAGISNYSIFQNGNQFFYCFECFDLKNAFNYINQNEECQKWNAITSKMVKGSFDFKLEEPIKLMREVFYLK